MSRILIRQILTGLFIVAVIALSLNYGILPQSRSFLEKIEEANRTDTLSSLELEELQRLKRLSEIQPQIELQLDYLHDAIPLDIEISAYVDILDELVARNGVQINFIQIDDALLYTLPEHVAAEELLTKAIERSEERLNSIPIDFAVTGSYANLVSFMDELQKAPRTTLIQSATLSAGTGTRTYSLTLQTLIFSISPAQAEG